MSSRCGAICSTSNSIIPPRTKSLSISSSFFTPERSYAPSRSQLLHIVEAHATPYVKQHCNLLLLFTVWEGSMSTIAKSLRARLASPQYALFASIWGIKHLPPTQLDSGHASDITCKDLVHHFKRLTY